MSASIDRLRALQSHRETLANVKTMADDLADSVDAANCQGPNDLVAAWVDFRLVFDQLTSLQKEMSKFNELVKKKLIPESFDAHDIKNITTTTGFRVQLQSKTYCSMHDKVKGMKFFEENYPEMITHTINASRLESFVKECLDNGEEPDDTIFRVSFGEVASMTKVKPK